MSRHAAHLHRTSRAAPTVAPMARAIRNALVASALALAWHAPAVLAGTADCGPGAPRNVVACGEAAETLRVDDPAIVAGGLLPSAVHGPRPAGTTNVVHSGSTDVTDPGDAVGIAYSDGILSIVNTGSIGAHGGTSAIAVDAAGGDVGVDNAGPIVADVTNPGAYGPAIGVRAFGDTVRVGNDAGGLISVTADGGQARARGVYAVAFGGEVRVDNQGAIDALAVGDGGRAEAHGVYAFGYGGPTTVVNAGDIASHAVAAGGFAYATGVNAIGYGSGSNLSSVVNTGDIHALAEGAYAYAFGIFNLTRQRYGDAYTGNDGDIRAEAVGDLATATGLMSIAVRYGDAATVNSGTVTAVADGTGGGSATGLYTHAYVYDASVVNTGAVTATGSGDIALAIGIFAEAGTYGDVSLHNAGAVTARAYGGDAFARATGLGAESENAAEVVNHGAVGAGADATAGDASATGIIVIGSSNATLLNYADVDAVAHAVDGYAYAYGAMAFASNTGIALLVNGGDLYAAASAVNGNSYAAAAFVTADVASIFNDGSATAVALASTGNAAAYAAWADGAYSAISNYGDLVAHAEAADGDAIARGAESSGYFGSTVYNSGAIGAEALADGVASAAGIYNMATVFSAYATNLGEITAAAQGASATANGIVNVSRFYGHAVTVNEGDIDSIAVGGVAPYGEIEALAFGVYNFAYAYYSVVDNSGTITARAVAPAELELADGFVQAQALGIVALNQVGVGDTLVYNDGVVSATSVVDHLGLATSWGIAAQSPGIFGGDVVVENNGSVEALAFAGTGAAESVGISAQNFYGMSQVVNRGDVLAVAETVRGIGGYLTNYAYATGVRANSMYGAVDVANEGDITAIARSYGAINGARGVQASGAYGSVTNAAGATITAMGLADGFGGGFATGIEVYGRYLAEVVNDGTIVAYGSSSALYVDATHGYYGGSSATGIYASANRFGDVDLVNNGDIFATAIHHEGFEQIQSGAGATGIHAYAKYDASIVNTGNIVASADAAIGIASTYGIVGEGKYSTDLVNQGDVFALSTVGSNPGDIRGGFAIAVGLKVFNSDHVNVRNDGLVVAHASVTGAVDTYSYMPSNAIARGASIGYNSTVIDAVLSNYGAIEAIADAGLGIASAYGTFVDTLYDSTTVNRGDILAVARADQGEAWAVGAFGYSMYFEYYVPCDNYGCDWGNGTFTPADGVAMLENSGTIIAAAYADGGVADAYGAAQIGGFGAYLVNNGDIRAQAAADDAHASGALLNSFYAGAIAENNGLISAVATGAMARAEGVTLIGETGAALANTGDIVAAAWGQDAVAVGVDIDAVGTATLVNTGLIGAFGDGQRIAIRSGSDASTTIANGGDVVGAIVTGDLADTFTNAAGGTWFALGASDFGAGADTVSNAGTILLDDATVRLGAAGEGDAFANFATLLVDGDSALTLGGTFANQGLLSFLDGAVGDTLQLTGDLAGQGSLRFDVDGAAGTGDWLRIDGNVLAGSVQTLDVNLTGLPTDASFLVPLVNVSGDSTAANFALGDVGYQAGFLTLDLALRADIDAGNTRDDVFALAVDVSGLSASGSLAAAVAPGAQSLIQGQVGGRRERVGANPAPADTFGLGPWLRVWRESGALDVEHAQAFGGGGDYRFDQDNGGREAGFDFATGTPLHLGLMVGSAQADQAFGGGVGRSHLDMDSSGLYASWVGARFYAEASWRTFDFEARLAAATGPLETHGNAMAVSLEAGWTGLRLGAFELVPQVQYTRSRIDDIAVIDTAHGSFAADGGVSERLRAGVAVSRAFTAGRITWTPFAGLDAIHEFEGGSRYTVADVFAGETGTDGTSGRLELGLGAQVAGWSLTAAANWSDGAARDGFAGGQVVARFTW